MRCFLSVLVLYASDGISLEGWGVLKAHPYRASGVLSAFQVSETGRSASVARIFTPEGVLVSSRRTPPNGVLRTWEAGRRNLVVLGDMRRVGVFTSCSVAAASWKIVAIFTPWLDVAVFRERFGVPLRFLPLLGVALGYKQRSVGGGEIPVTGELPRNSTEATTRLIKTISSQKHFDEPWEWLAL